MKNLFLSLALLCSVSIFASAPVEKTKVIASQEIINKDGSKMEIAIVEEEDFVHTCIVKYTENGNTSTTTYTNVPDNMTCTEVGIIHALKKAQE